MDRIPKDFADMVDPASTAVIMWDFQVGLGGKAVELERVIPAAQRLLAAADDANVPVFWSRHFRPPVEQTPAGSLYRAMRKYGVSSPNELGSELEVGSPEWQYIAELQPRDHDFVIDKMTPTFFEGTSLRLRLTSLGIRTLVFAGVATEIGVDLTAKHAFALGFFPVVLEDAVSSYTKEKYEVGIAGLKTWIPVVQTDDVVSIWNGSSS